MVTLSESAAIKIKEVMSQDPKLGDCLRIYTTGGGCHGLTYGIQLDFKQDNDTVLESQGVRVVIDPTSLQHSDGIEIDYKEYSKGTGFLIRVPEIPITCGCASTSPNSKIP